MCKSLLIEIQGEGWGAVYDIPALSCLYIFIFLLFLNWFLPIDIKVAKSKKWDIDKRSAPLVDNWCVQRKIGTSMLERFNMNTFLQLRFTREFPRIYSNLDKAGWASNFLQEIWVTNWFLLIMIGMVMLIVNGHSGPGWLNLPRERAEPPQGMASSQQVTETEPSRIFQLYLVPWCNIILKQWRPNR